MVEVPYGQSGREGGGRVQAATRPRINHLELLVYIPSSQQVRVGTRVDGVSRKSLICQLVLGQGSTCSQPSTIVFLKH